MLHHSGVRFAYKSFPVHLGLGNTYQHTWMVEFHKLLLTAQLFSTLWLQLAGNDYLTFFLVLTIV
jgi:hypothetical protein